MQIIFAKLSHTFIYLFLLLLLYIITIIIVIIIYLNDSFVILVFQLKNTIFVTLMFSPDIRELKSNDGDGNENGLDWQSSLWNYCALFRRRLLMFSQAKIRANWFGVVFISLDRLYYAIDRHTKMTYFED